MKKVLMAALVCGVAQTGWAYDESEPDSIALNELSEVVVKAVKAQKYAPFAVSRIGKEEVQQFARSGQELPFLLSRTPGVTAWSENGLGTGTTYMRLRGSGDSRINVTLDGVSLNSPEDQCVFWANMNSYAALLGGMQVQRGVGTSTNGDGAFGGSVVLSTATPGLVPSAQVSASYGSYGTYNAGGKFSSGLMGNHWMLDGAYHHTGTDGYVHGTGGQSGSYYGGLTYVNTDGTLKLSYKNIGNYEKTGQAWNGVTAGNDDYSMNAYDGVRTYADMYRLGLGKYNSLYERFEPDWNGGWTTERYRLADGTLWDKTTDNFRQNHNLLNLAWRINDFWSTSATLHYTHGHGYYDEFRYQNKLKKFGLSNFVLSDGSVLKKTDFVRQKGLTQDTYGMVWNVNYQDRRWDVMAGASFRNFEGNHWGYLTYVANEELRQEVLADGKYKYYDSDATKADNQLF
ncbi:MAG: TonB-dependent receptor plug domain-containing protein, partial [Bacteroidaceae bacterium]|nr:TonB-dependent receptor plug domain-containing protein [Bacteroidaceae bacterium]